MKLLCGLLPDIRKEHTCQLMSADDLDRNEIQQSRGMEPFRLQSSQLATSDGSGSETLATFSVHGHPPKDLRPDRGRRIQNEFHLKVGALSRSWSSRSSTTKPGSLEMGSGYSSHPARTSKLDGRWPGSISAPTRIIRLIYKANAIVGRDVIAELNAIPKR